MFKSLKILSVILFSFLYITACEQLDELAVDASTGEGTQSAAISNIASFSLTPNDSVSIVKDFLSSEHSYLPELLGNNALNAHYDDGTNETVDCWGHHYNADINEHVLHCTSPSTGGDIYLGLSSSDTSVISFTYEWNTTYYMSYWQPLMAGTTQITGRLLFADNTPEFTLYVTLSSAP
ncbi:MAG: hypothetical protein OEY11_03805 [Gammaproteobacteria bacterium]|nr:hypothetical protein [Gammaproteobacteria bacterium]